MDQVFTLNEVVAKRAEEDASTLLAFRRPTTGCRNQGSSQNFGLQVLGKCFALLRDILAQVQRVVSVNGVPSGKVTIDAGVPQGSVLSPFLYALFIEAYMSLCVRGWASQSTAGGFHCCYMRTTCACWQRTRGPYSHAGGAGLLRAEVAI